MINVKRFISFLFAFVFVFLCSCSLPKEIVESVNLDLDFLQDKTVTNIDNNDRYILIRCVPFVSEEEYYESSAEESYYYVWDIERSRLKSTLEFKESYNDDNYISDIEINDKNEITLYTYNNPSQSRVYDLSFRLTGYCNDSFVTIEEKLDADMKSSDLINADRFARYGNLATDSFYISKTVSVFLDDPKNVYITDNDNAFNVISTKGKQVLSSSYDENDTSITYRLTDYDSLVNREIKVEYGKYSYPGVSSMSGKYSVISVCDETGKSNTITVINNFSGTSSTADVTKISAVDIDSKINSIRDEIKSKYGVETQLAEEYDENTIPNDYFYDNNYSKAQILLAIYDFEKCLSTFPAEFYSEIISSETSFDKLKFYFVGSFDYEKNSNDISAYCSNTNGELYIVYSVNGFTYSTFCHELMHAMEYRINDNVPYFYDEWNQLNPYGFEYTYFDNEKNLFYENEENQQYFIRDYGTNNELEDRATVFEEVCDCEFRNEELPWWAERKPLSDKASYLKNAIRSSFPSLSNIWETYDNLI